MAPPPATFDYRMKLLLIGDSAVGKTSLLLRFCEDTYNTSFITTIGIDFKIKTIVLDGKTAKLLIWDTAGQDRFKTITSAYYRGAMGVFLAYDITNRESFDNVQTWMERVKEKSPEGIQKMLIGCKCDYEEKRQVSTKEGEDLALELGIPFCEVSAAKDINVTDIFLQLAGMIKTEADKTNVVSTVNTPSPFSADNPGGCC